MRRLRNLRLAAMAVGLVWAGVTGYILLSAPDINAAFEQQRYNRQLEECRGERASQRFDCRSDLILGQLRGQFFDWTYRVGLIFGPPLFGIWLVTKLATPKRPPPGGAFREKPPRPDNQDQDAPP